MRCSHVDLSYLDITHRNCHQASAYSAAFWCLIILLCLECRHRVSLRMQKGSGPHPQWWHSLTRGSGLLDSQPNDRCAELCGLHHVFQRQVLLLHWHMNFVLLHCRRLQIQKTPSTLSSVSLAGNMMTRWCRRRCRWFCYSLCSDLEHLFCCCSQYIVGINLNYLSFVSVVLQMVSYKIVKADNGDAWVEVSPVPPC